MTALLRVRNLTVGYAGLPALNCASLEVDAGRVVALVGANGAGKTTLLRAILGVVPSQEGEIVLDGSDLRSVGVAGRVELGIGYAPEGRRVFAGLTVRENLEVAGESSGSSRASRIAEMEALFPDLAEKAGERAWQLSGGQQQMLAVARALMRRPRLLLLDEPSLGLAPALVSTLFANLRRIADEGVAILLAEQNLPATLAIADQVAALRQGRIIRTAPASELRADTQWASELL